MRKCGSVPFIKGTNVYTKEIKWKSLREIIIIVSIFVLLVCRRIQKS